MRLSAQINQRRLSTEILPGQEVLLWFKKKKKSFLKKNLRKQRKGEFFERTKRENCWKNIVTFRHHVFNFHRFNFLIDLGCYFLGMIMVIIISSSIRYSIIY